MTRRAPLAVLAFMLFGFAYGIASYRYDLFPTHELRAGYARLLGDTVETIGFRDASGRTRVECGAAGTNVAVLLAFGQSNAANHGESRHSAGPQVLNFNVFDGQCYGASDPLLGATGKGGSVWSRLSDMLIARNAYARVVIAPIAVSASSITRWAPGGDLNDRIASTVKQLAARGLAPTHLLWQQGEADAMQAMSRAEYEGHFSKLRASVRAMGVRAPIYVAVSTICQGPGSAEIRAAQQALPDAFDDVRAGANTDTLDSMAARYDGCHFSKLALDRATEKWFQAITAALIKPR